MRPACHGELSLLLAAQGELCPGEGDASAPGSTPAPGSMGQVRALPWAVLNWRLCGAGARNSNLLISVPSPKPLQSLELLLSHPKSTPELMPCLDTYSDNSAHVQTHTHTSCSAGTHFHQHARTHSHALSTPVILHRQLNPNYRQASLIPAPDCKALFFLVSSQLPGQINKNIHGLLI